MRSSSNGALLNENMCGTEVCWTLELQSVTGMGGGTVNKTWEEGARDVCSI